MKTLEELMALRDAAKAQMTTRDDSSEVTRIVVGMATCGIASGARPVLNALADAVMNKKLEDVAVVQTGCIGLCQFEPIVEVIAPGKEKVTYVHMTPEKAEEIVEQHLIRGQVVTQYTLGAANK